ncbi:hypothetical protein BBP40_008858 [Aspergillus hancockii]|nr:hypothetical protein BBP40_008858 [Aspergillus hancockii]
MPSLPGVRSEAGHGPVRIHLINDIVTDIDGKQTAPSGAAATQRGKWRRGNDHPAAAPPFAAPGRPKTLHPPAPAPAPIGGIRSRPKKPWKLT